MGLPGDAAAAIYRHDLAGDVRSVGSKEQCRSRDVECRPGALEQRAADYFLLKSVVGDSGFGPHHGSRGDGVYADLRAKFAGERPCQHDEPRFGDSVHGVASQGPHAVYVDNVEDESLREAQHGRCSLREKQRRFEIRTEQIFPVRLGDFTDGCRVKGRGVIDENVEPTELLLSELDEFAESCCVEKIEADAGGATGTRRLELCYEVARFAGRSVVVDHHIGSGSVKYPRDFGAHTPRAAGDQCDLAGERLIGAKRRTGRRVGAHGERL